MLHATIVRSPEERAIFHYITQTLFRIPHYQIYLVLDDGVGLSILIASVLRFSTLNNQIQIAVPADGPVVRPERGFNAAFVALIARELLELASLSRGRERRPALD